MPPKTTSTCPARPAWPPSAAATLSSVAPSSRYSSRCRPSRPPLALMSSMTILATLALAMPTNESGPVWSAMTPTLMGSTPELGYAAMACPPLRLSVSALRGATTSRASCEDSARATCRGRYIGRVSPSSTRRFASVSSSPRWPSRRTTPSASRWSRSCARACSPRWICEAAGFDEELRDTVYWVALLRYVGCTGHAHEVATVFGDEIAIRAQTLVHDAANPAEVMRDVMAFATAGRSPEEREQIVRMIQQTAHEWAVHNFTSGCEVADMLVQRLDFGRRRSRCAALHVRALERQRLPDPRAGRGDPARDARRAPQPRHGGDRPPFSPAKRSRPPAIVATAPTTRRSPTCSSRTDAAWFDQLAQDRAVGRRARPRAGAAPHARRRGTRRRPHRGRRLHRPQVAVHGRAQPSLRGARSATPPGCSGSTDDAVTTLRRAALVHDFGTTGVPNSIWDKPRPAHARGVRSRRAAPDADRADAAPLGGAGGR